jgi:hypothetical protein
LVTVSAVGLQALDAPGLTRLQTAKWWTVSAALRGFYDDNYFTAPKGLEQSSLGFEITPYLAANFPREQTYIGVSYEYRARYYADREDNKWDQTHLFVAKFDHKFSPRFNLNVDDVFTYSSEPELLEQTGAVSTPLRTDSSALRNRFTAGFNGMITELLGFEVGFQNTWYDYLQEQDDVVSVYNPFGLSSQSALLDRVEYLPHIDVRYQARENLVGLVGYQFGVVDYTSDQPVGLIDNGLVAGVQDPFDTPIPGSDRSSQSHYLYVGGDYTVSAQWTAAARVGAQYTSFDDLNSGDGWSPYVDVSATDQYLPGSYLRLGVRYTRNATDVAGWTQTLVNSVDDLATDQESLVLYGTVSHRITPRLTGNLTGTIQHSEFQNGIYDGEVDWFFLTGVSLDYKFTEHWSAEVAYNFDRLDSDLQLRSFSRNRIFMGVRATY